MRNKIKRRLRSLASEILSVKGKLNWNYVIIGKKNALNEHAYVITGKMSPFSSDDE